MLKGIDPILGPDLLHALRAMGHGDEICIADANFPATTNAKRLIRVDAADAVQVADAILRGDAARHVSSKTPLSSCSWSARRTRRRRCSGLFQKAIERRETGFTIAPLERFAFYARARNCFAIVATGERRLYGNLILTKGVVPPA